MEAAVQDNVRREISEYLNSVKHHLAHLSERERQAVLDNLELQIRDTLKQRLGSQAPAIDDVRAVISEMDAPESFGSEDEPRYAPRMLFLRKLIKSAAILLGASVLLMCLCPLADKHLYIAYTTMIEATSDFDRLNVHSGSGPHSQKQLQGMIQSTAFRTKIAGRAVDRLKLSGINMTPETLIRDTQIESVANSDIFGIAVTSPDREQAVTEARVIAEEMQKASSEVAPLAQVGGKNQPSIRVLEEPHARPAGRHLSGVLAIFGMLGIGVSFLLFIFAGAARLWTRIQSPAGG